MKEEDMDTSNEKDVSATSRYRYLSLQESLEVVASSSRTLQVKLRTTVGEPEVWSTFDKYARFGIEELLHARFREKLSPLELSFVAALQKLEVNRPSRPDERIVSSIVLEGGAIYLSANVDTGIPLGRVRKARITITELFDD